MYKMHGIAQIKVADLKILRDKKAAHVLLDVREPDEYALCKIPGSLLIPLGELPARFSELPKDKEIIVHCHHGGLSAQAVNFLAEQGFEKVKNLAGGIDAWSC